MKRVVVEVVVDQVSGRELGDREAGMRVANALSDVTIDLSGTTFAVGRVKVQRVENISAD